MSTKETPAEIREAATMRCVERMLTWASSAVDRADNAEDLIDKMGELMTARRLRECAESLRDELGPQL